MQDLRFSFYGSFWIHNREAICQEHEKANLKSCPVAHHAKWTVCAKRLFKFIGKQTFHNTKLQLPERFYFQSKFNTLQMNFLSCFLFGNKHLHIICSNQDLFFINAKFSGGMISTPMNHWCNRLSENHSHGTARSFSLIRTHSSTTAKSGICPKERMLFQFFSHPAWLKLWII